MWKHASRSPVQAPVPLANVAEPVTEGRAVHMLVGVASVIDGDTLEIHGTRIRLNGIDAPEAGQTCMTSNEQYRCGQSAALFLSDAIGRSQVSCEPLDRDRYGRIVAKCMTNNNDLGSLMVGSGWALAYRRYDTVYVPQEDNAREERLGLWSGEFVEPWLWREGQRLGGSEHGG